MFDELAKRSLKSPLAVIKHTYVRLATYLSIEKVAPVIFYSPQFKRFECITRCAYTHVYSCVLASEK